MRPLLLLLAACMAVPALANEDVDYGVPPVSALRTSDFHAPTPREVPGAKTIGTSALRESLPGAIWLPGAGRGQSFTDTIQARFAQALAAAAKGDRKRALVFFCQGPQCWLSYNAALRAVRLGYETVYWYRGGIEAWIAAGGELAPMKLTWRNPPE